MVRPSRIGPLLVVRGNVESAARGTWRYRQGWLEGLGRLDLQLDQLSDGVERVAKQEAGAVEGAEQVGQHREGGALDLAEQEGGTAGLVNPALDGGDFEIRVDRLADLDKLAVRGQVGDAVGEVSVAHERVFIPWLAE